ncbi:transcription termination factor MTEF1, chloroplastic [Cryptomeria japonica]|uniref:transcription termination factor MTEF1, chloroplastic n=1 Tax=Cryptomeria japonica TaxID=3369 RepID=UPI0025ACF09F|nr:transcription termination factor MTEF1, chloroplastic [Cryptomeria japonica]XP_057870504.1 transcription termination factor MTEF1, chloroplastic [Cryptomeria japonica]XP_057870505.1 transcription termination factor MTEF1, chloroplastic [Cryptomeria japonica]XP_057870506.1 transcription termination factor MTEF1, chloroplastic [Cryptomeria japonica]XP_057870507.1 transcription termination factor MTEF1, chloroplastic [Cryptomeria japonica]
MDCLVCRCSVYDTRVSLFTRPASLVSFLPSIRVHLVALTTPDFHLSFVRYPPTVFISSKFSWRISCDSIPKPSQINPQVEESRQRRHNAMKQFLLKECCFSSSQITLLISKDPSLFRRRSLHRAHQVLQMLEDCGLTVEQIRKTIIKSPTILIRSVDDHLKPKIEYLKTLGIADEDVNYIVSHNPRLLTSRLNETIAPKISSLIKFFGSKANLLKALRKAPEVASYDVKLLNNKLKVLENTGLLEHEIKRILERCPRILFCSVGKIEKNMEFLTCIVGLKPNVLVKYPQFLGFSVEKRLRPRYEVFKYLIASRARHHLTIHRVTILALTEGDFTQRFLSGSPDVKMLYEKYKGKTADVGVTKLLPTRQR